MAKKLWGGRFKKMIDPEFFEFQKSIHYDYKLGKYDIMHSKIHILALWKFGLLERGEYDKLFDALDAISKEIETKGDKFILNDLDPKKDVNIEDIHTYIQDRVEKKVGPSLALKLHTLRSRNDQVVFDEKHYCQREALNIIGALIELEKSFISLVEKYKNQYFVGYTHTQRAQAIKFKDYLHAYLSMFYRDNDRISRFYDSLIVFVGAGALTGSSLTRKAYNEAIEEYLKKKDWKGIRTTENSLDNVSDRDFIIEFLSILSILQLHLSRLSEDFILYSTKEFNFIELPEEFCTGSSLMPHKKNPDFLELVRGNSGKIYGNLMSILTTMKGLPLTYNRDMQLDKEPLFSSVETIKQEIKVMSKLLKSIELNKENKDRINCVLEDKTLYATELADWFVRDKNTKVPFKQAHDIVGKLIKLAEKKGGIDEISNQELKKEIHPALTKDVIHKVMNAKYAIDSKQTFSKRAPRKQAGKVKRKIGFNIS